MLWGKWGVAMADKEVMNTEETAEFLGLKPFTIREYAKQGVIPAKKLGKQWRFVKADLLDWLRGKKQTGQEER
jgi:excisionase family DNA binding protein